MSRWFNPFSHPFGLTPNKPGVSAFRRVRWPRLAPNLGAAGATRPVPESRERPATFPTPLPTGEQFARDHERPDMTRHPIDVLTDQAGLRIGCDLHAVANVAESIAVFGDLYLERVFTPAELEQCEGPNLVERLAGRFAAKEAVVKALRVPADVAVPWNTIEVLSGAVGAPTVSLHNGVAIFARAQYIVRVEASISHDDGFAMAVAVAVVDTYAGESRR